MIHLQTINYTRILHTQEMKFLKLRKDPHTVSNLLEIKDTSRHVCPTCICVSEYPISGHATRVEYPCNIGCGCCKFLITALHDLLLHLNSELAICCFQGCFWLDICNKSVKT